MAITFSQELILEVETGLINLHT